MAVQDCSQGAQKSPTDEPRTGALRSTVYSVEDKVGYEASETGARDEVSSVNSPTRVSLLSLPAELIDHIFSYLAPFYQLTLAKCCRVCKALLPPARRGLYQWVALRVLTVEGGWLPERMGLSALPSLERYPHLRPLVREVSCWVSEARDFDIQEGWGISAEQTMNGLDFKPEWLAAFLAKHGIDGERQIRGLFSLTHLTINHLSTLDLNSEHYLSCLLPSFTFPGVVELGTSYFLPEHVASFPYLHKLTCHNPPAVNSALVKMIKPPAFTHLTIMDMERCEGVDARFFAWIACSSGGTLLTLQIPFSDIFPSDLTAFAHLKHLHLESGPSPDAWDLPEYPPTRSLPPLPTSLRRLTLGDLSQKPSPATSPAGTFLTTLPATLETLSLAAPVFHASVFTQLIADQSYLPALRIFDIRGAFSYSRNEPNPWTDSEVEEVERACKAHGVRMLPGETLWGFCNEEDSE